MDQKWFLLHVASFAEVRTHNYAKTDLNVSMQISFPSANVNTKYFLAELSIKTGQVLKSATSDLN